MTTVFHPDPTTVPPLGMQNPILLSNNILIKVKVKVIGFSTDTTHGIRLYVKPGTPNPPTVAPPTAVTAW